MTFNCWNYIPMFIDYLRQFKILSRRLDTWCRELHVSLPVQQTSSSWLRCSVVNNTHLWFVNWRNLIVFTYELLHLFESETGLCQNFVFGRERCLRGCGEVGTGRARGAIVNVPNDRILNSRGKIVCCRWRTFKVNAQSNHVTVESVVFKNSISVTDSVRV